VVGDALVVDAVAHAYNWAEPNFANPLAAGFSQAGYGLHTLVSPDDAHRMTPEEFITDWDVETLERVFFLETDVDLVAYHSTPLHDYYKDGLVSLDKGVQMKERNPDRVVLYGNINPLEGQAALDEMERQVTELGVSSIKLYPARYYQGRTLPERLDDPKFGIPMIERAIELGVKSIAVHKAIPFGPTHTTYYHLDDFDEVAAQYPEMNFEVVHAGFAFLEETNFLLGRFQNVYVNLEVTASLAINNPRRFAEVIANFLYWGGEDRIFFATGCSFVHPQPVINALMAFEVPEDLITGYGLPQITDEAKRKILGANWCRMHGLDVEQVKQKIADDRWAQERRGNGRAAPWSAIRAGAPA
jgi:uncharacterized protein